jgi:hypothetical protein
MSSSKRALSLGAATCASFGKQRLATLAGTLQRPPLCLFGPIYDLCCAPTRATRERRCKCVEGFETHELGACKCTTSVLLQTATSVTNIHPKLKSDQHFDVATIAASPDGRYLVLSGAEVSSRVPVDCCQWLQQRADSARTAGSIVLVAGEPCHWRASHSPCCH